MNNINVWFSSDKDSFDIWTKGIWMMLVIIVRAILATGVSLGAYDLLQRLNTLLPG